VKPESPYKGLVPFEDSELDALFFFGRERESEIIAANLLAARLTVLYGPSGVGKTSVLRAGVAHRLRELARTNLEERGHPEFAVVLFDAWSDEPVAALLAAVRDELASLFGSALLDEAEGESLADTLARWTEALACDVLLILDQAEEYFLYHDEDAGFAEELPELVTRPGLRVRVLLSLREDALAKLDRFKGRIPSLFANYLRLDHLDRRAASDAIVKPLERYNELTGESIEIEPALVEAVLEQTVAGKVDLGEAGRGATRDEADEGRIEAPYLQLVMERIWEEERSAGSNRLRLATLERLGGAESVVRAHLRRAVEDLTSAEKDVAADVFRYLVTPSGTKIAHGLGDLAEYTAVDEQRLLPVLTTLRRERIVRPVDGAGANGDRYEIYHDVLADAVLGWRREQELERERRTAEKRHRRLAVLALGSLIALAAMTLVAIYAFAQRREAQDQRRAARAQATQARAGQLAATAVAQLLTDPDQSVELAHQVARLDPTPRIEDLLRRSLVASRVRRVFRPGDGAVTEAEYSPDGSRVVTASADGSVRVFRVRTGQELGALRHKGRATSASFSPDGRLIATAGSDRTARLWSGGAAPARVLPHPAGVRDAVLSFDSAYLVTVADDAAVRVWDVDTGELLNTFFEPRAARRLVASPALQLIASFGADSLARVYDVAAGRLVAALPHEGRVTSAAFGPGGRFLITGSAGADWLGRVWNLPRGPVRSLLKGHQGQIFGVAFSPRGHHVATVGSDGTGIVWDLAEEGGAQESELIGHTNFVHEVAFSPGGFFVVTASRDGTARVWKVDRGNQEGLLLGHDGSVRGARFSPGGRQVLTWSDDGTARIWDVEFDPLLRRLGRHAEAATEVETTRDGKLAISAGSDGTARMWRLPFGRGPVLISGAPVTDLALNRDDSLIATANRLGTRVWGRSGDEVASLPQSGALSVVFSPDSRLVATGDEGGGVQLTRLPNGTRPKRLRQPGAVTKLAFNPDGDELAAGGADGAVRLWNSEDGKLRRTLPPLGGRIVGLEYSRDGRRLAVAARDTEGQLWDPVAGKLVATLSGHAGALTSARFSPDGSLLVTASIDHDARIWDARTGELRRVLSGHFALVSDARFSDDGRWIVTAGPGTAGVWEVRTGKLLFLLRGHDGILRSAAFAPGGHTFVTAGEDGTVRTYDCNVCGDLDELIQLAEERLARISGS
jgi:WD40 repeat protein